MKLLQKTKENEEKKNYVKFTGNCVKIMTCASCNMKCKHCYIPYEGDIDPNTLKDIVSKLSKKYTVRLNGTEPLLNKQYLKSFKLAKEELVMTNGLVFKDNLQYIDDIKKAGVKRICISYQFEIQKEINSVGLNYLDEIFPAIRARGLDLEMMCTITSKNYKDLDKICEKAKQLNANYLYLLEYMYQGQAKSKMDGKLRLTNRQRANFLKNLDEVRKKYKKDELYVYRSGNFGSCKTKKVGCDAGRGMVAMTPDFKIYPCNFLIDKKYCLGYYENGEIFIDKEKQSTLCADYEDCLWKVLEGSN